jgi:hypothetical protein
MLCMTYCTPRLSAVLVSVALPAEPPPVANIWFVNSTPRLTQSAMAREGGVLHQRQMLAGPHQQQRNGGERRGLGKWQQQPFPIRGGVAT